MEKTIQLEATTNLLQEQPYLFNDDNQISFRDAILTGVNLIQKKIFSIQKPFSGIMPHELAEQFENINLDLPFTEVKDALKELERLYMDHAIYFHHPKYVAHLNCPIVIPSLLAELILTSLNSSLDTWDQSAGGTLIEQKLIDWTAEKIGYGPNADGIFTSGGTQSNLMGLLLARNHYCHNVLNHNTKVFGLPIEFYRFRVFTSEVSHFSIQKSLAILGLGYSSVIQVPCDKEYRMDKNELDKEIKKCLQNNLIPIAIVATAGSTDFGSIDPLKEIASLCLKYNLWMHVDAAYGCGLLVSQNNRNLINGIHYADSITIDYHKSFFQPVSCGAFLVKDGKNLSFVTHHADYLNPLSQVKEGTPNLVNKSIQTTRRFDALKLWLTLRTMGHEWIGRAFDKVVELANQSFLLLQLEETIEVLHKPQLSTLVFRYLPEEECNEKIIDEINHNIRKSILRSGEAVIAGTKVNGKQYLKFTLLNPATTVDDITEILSVIKHQGQSYLRQINKNKVSHGK